MRFGSRGQARQERKAAQERLGQLDEQLNHVFYRVESSLPPQTHARVLKTAGQQYQPLGLLMDTEVERLLGEIQGSAEAAVAAYTAVYQRLYPDVNAIPETMDNRLRNAQEPDPESSMFTFERRVSNLRQPDEAQGVLAAAAEQSGLAGEVREALTQPQQSIPVTGDDFREAPEASTVFSVLKAEGDRAAQLSTTLRERVSTIEQASRYAAAAQGIDALGQREAEWARSMLVGREEPLVAGFLSNLTERAASSVTALGDAADFMDEYGPAVEAAGEGTAEPFHDAARSLRTAAGATRKLHGSLTDLRGKWRPSPGASQSPGGARQ